MPNTTASIKKKSEVSAIVYPACLCGRPWTEHGVRDCGGYKPSRPIEDLGVVAFSSPNVLAQASWKLEQLVQRLRKALT